jgi:hypothetical protein
MKAIEIFYSPVVNVRKMEDGDSDDDGDGDGDGDGGGDGLGVISGSTHGCL